jgi:hypothetical protein
MSDFKSRFAGKMTKINAEGGIDEMIATSQQPIKKDDRIIMGPGMPQSANHTGESYHDNTSNRNIT